MMPDSAITTAELRAWRDQLGFSRSAAAKALGVEPAVYRSLEKGEVKISETIAKLCGALTLLDLINTVGYAAQDFAGLVRGVGEGEGIYIQPKAKARRKEGRQKEKA